MQCPLTSTRSVPMGIQNISYTSCAIERLMCCGFEGKKKKPKSSIFVDSSVDFNGEGFRSKLQLVKRMAAQMQLDDIIGAEQEINVITTCHH